MRGRWTAVLLAVAVVCGSAAADPPAALAAEPDPERSQPQRYTVTLVTGRLDARLFDVGRLIEAGYDDRSRADLPLIVEHRGTRANLRATVAVLASYDDGRTWRRLPVVRSGANWRAIAKHPAGPGFVSLRTIVTDTRGNSVDDTMIRAYGLS